MKTFNECVKEITETIATMMDTLPNPAIAVVTIKDEKKSKHKKATVDEVQQELDK